MFRRNTYGALEGLVGRTAALRLPGRPARYRATDPAALIAQLAAQQGEAELPAHLLVESQVNPEHGERFE